MEKNLESRDGTLSLEVLDGSMQAPWRSVRVFSASKPCLRCGELFRPKVDVAETVWNRRRFCAPCGRIKPESWRQSHMRAQKTCESCGRSFQPWTGSNGEIQSQKAWKRQVCCSISCSKKLKNPMHSDIAILKLSDTLRRIGHRPQVRGGNGRELTLPQQSVLSALGDGWEAEVSVRTFKKRGSGYPNCYKIDIANRTLKIGVEIDGPCHVGKRRKLDEKKDQLLVMLGWKIYRVTNKSAMSMCSISKSADTLLTLLRAF